MNSQEYYKRKYNKYKFKYWALKKIQYGSGDKSARVYFFSRIKKKYHITHDVFSNDDFLKSRINSFTLPKIDEIESKSREEVEQILIFNEIYNLITREVNNDNIIDYVCALYLNNGLGEPNSLENIGRLKDNVSKFDILKKNKANDKGKSLHLNDFPTLENLETYIDNKYNELEQIRLKQQEKQKKKDSEIQKKIDGIDDVIVHLTTDKVTVYEPTTQKGSVYYGSNTKWCTASDNNNMFAHYNQQGPLYIIQSRSNIKDKYQIHFETNQYMNSDDREMSSEGILTHFDDNELRGWLYKTSDIKEISKESFNRSLSFLESPYYGDIKKLVLGDMFDQPLGDSFINLNNLVSLTFGKNFNQPLRDSLESLTKLEVLVFGDNFNQPFDTSLLKLHSLKKLTIGKNFSEPLGNSLSALTELQELTLGNNYTHPLNDSFSNLLNLKIIRFGYDFNFIYKIESLLYLPNLKEIYVSEKYRDSEEHQIYLHQFRNVELTSFTVQGPIISRNSYIDDWSDDDRTYDGRDDRDERDSDGYDSDDMYGPDSDDDDNARDRYYY